MRRKKRDALTGLLAVFCLGVTVGALVLAGPVVGGLGRAATLLVTATQDPGGALESAGEILRWQMEGQRSDGHSDGSETAEGAHSAPLGGDWSALPGAPSSQSQAETPPGMGSVQELHYTASAGGIYLPAGESGLIQNLTSLSAGQIAEAVAAPLPFQIQPGSDQPQVLIMHTHATETYLKEDVLWYDPAYTGRSTESGENMTAVGEVMAAELNAAGICTIQDCTYHDYPSYNGSYDRSRVTVQSYLERYPSIRVVIDVHRDAIQRADGNCVRPVATVEGEKSAQVMVICGADSGNGKLPNYLKNLAFAARWQQSMESLYPGLTRPVLLDYRNYNQGLTTGSLLIEVGGHVNTLDQAKTAGRAAARALAQLLLVG